MVYAFMMSSFSVSQQHLEDVSATDPFRHSHDIARDTPIAGLRRCKRPKNAYFSRLLDGFLRFAHAEALFNALLGLRPHDRKPEEE